MSQNYLYLLKVSLDYNSRKVGEKTVYTHAWLYQWCSRESLGKAWRGGEHRLKRTRAGLLPFLRCSCRWQAEVGKVRGRQGPHLLQLMWSRMKKRNRSGGNMLTAGKEEEVYSASWHLSEDLEKLALELSIDDVYGFLLIESGGRSTLGLSVGQYRISCRQAFLGWAKKTQEKNILVLLNFIFYQTKWQKWIILSQ